MATDALIDDVPSDLLDTIAGIERTIACLSALRARAIDTAHDWVYETEASRPTSRGPRADTEMARRLLVAELAALLRIPGNSAARLVAESRTLVESLPTTLAALTEGDISYGHARVVIDNAESLPEAGRGSFETAVLPAARRLNVARFADHARRTREREHPESLSTRRRTALERRSVAVEPARDGMAWLSIYGSAEKIVAMDDRLDRLTAALRSPEDPRTFVQLRADVFCDLVLRGEVSGVLPNGIRPQVLVTVPVLGLLGLADEPASLEGYGPIPLDVARGLAAEAPSFVRLLTHPETGTVLSVGRHRYAIPADMRLYLRARDETCRGVGCGHRAGTSDVDHGHEWAGGGTTSVDNLAHLCRGDHTRKTLLRWQVAHLPGGTLEWTTPLGRTYAPSRRRSSEPEPRAVNVRPMPRWSPIPWNAGDWASTAPDAAIVYGDNLVVTATLPDASVRLIYLDPPFNTGRTQQLQSITTTQADDGARTGFKGRSYESIKGSLTRYDDRFADYWGFLEPRLAEAWRLLDERGTLYLHLDYREAHYAKVALDALFGRESFLNELIWAYDYGAKSTRRWPAKHDTILVYVKDPARYHFDSAAVDREPYMAPGLVTPEKVARGKLPTDVWWHTIVSTNGAERTGYPTQKPHGILRRIVQASSEPGDLVLDFFAGSGTTGAAALEVGRRALLVDASPDAVAVMRARLSTAVVYEA